MGLYFKFPPMKVGGPIEAIDGIADLLDPTNISADESRRPH